MGERMFLKVEEVAAALGIKRSQVYFHIKGGHLGAVRLGRRLLIPAKALNELADQAAKNQNTKG